MIEDRKPRLSLKKYSLTIQIETGNLIHGEFNTVEELLEFALKHYYNPHEILIKISPEYRQQHWDEVLRREQTKRDVDDT